MRSIAIIAIVAVSGIALIGCGRSAQDSASLAETSATVATVDDGGWWCAEHGVPEEECALCDPSLVAKFKEAGDWCEEHKRPESQCYLCNPARFEKFAARYEAKFGTRPPKPTE
jgi:hypothetical protein